MSEERIREILEAFETVYRNHGDPSETAQAEFICIDAFPWIELCHGLGQLNPEQLASVYDRRQPVTADQFRFAEKVDKAFALQDKAVFVELLRLNDAPLPLRSSFGRQVQPQVAVGVAGTEVRKLSKGMSVTIAR